MTRLYDIRKEAAKLHVESGFISLDDASRVRLVALVCRHSPRYAMDIRSLAIDLDSKGLGKMLRYLNVILLCAKKITDLTLPAALLSLKAQKILFRKVKLTALQRLTIGQASYPAALSFMHSHRRTLRILQFLEEPSQASTPLRRVSLKGSLALDHIAGPVQLVADTLAYCLPDSQPLVQLSGPIAVSTLEGLRAHLSGQHVLNLTIHVDPTTGQLLPPLAECFPHLRCLRVIEQRSTTQEHSHIWDAASWQPSLARMPDLKRVSVVIPEVESVALGVHGWFPHAGTNAALDVELCSGADILQMWKKPWGTAKWERLYPRN
ncbi:hypothetical protein K525DRAFT_275017 [Schizophyllum commune Loenen D]|nr:hypothetical protein K525DRAFT_275017 [Schizophyllum commune Loenen D]